MPTNSAVLALSIYVLSDLVSSVTLVSLSGYLTLDTGKLDLNFDIHTSREIQAHQHVDRF